MKIISWNVQGLGGSLCKQYKRRFRQELHKCIIGQVDIVMLQEHHLNERRTKVYGSLLPGKWEMVWVPAYGSTQLKGGLCMAIRDIWQVKMLEVGNLFLGRAQYVIMEFHNKKVGILNLYAPNSSRERLKMWIELDRSLPTVDHWCIAGDFNMIEDPEDRSGEGGVTVHGLELSAWERFTISRRLVDVWHLPSFGKLHNSLRFSRSDRRVNGANLSRIDRIYVDDLFAEIGGSVGIYPGTTFSDHAPVVLQLKVGKKHKQQGRIRIPPELFTESIITEQVMYIWRQTLLQIGNVEDNVTLAISHISSFLISWVQGKKETYTQKINSMHRALASLQHFQERDPLCEWTANALHNAKWELRKIEDNILNFQYQASASKWTQVGDKVNKMFFSQVAPKWSTIGIKQLRREDGSLTVDESEIVQIATTYYAKLLTADVATESVHISRKRVWDQIKPKVTNEMKVALVKPFDIMEIHNALRALSLMSCPGEDGITPHFFLNYWEYIGEDLTKAYQRIFDTGYMPRSMAVGLIYLIPKGEGISDDIRKWRPITLLNTIYKVFAKTLALRVQPFLHDLIHITQTGFIQERSILDNLFFFWEAIALARKKKENLVILLLDFEKAYDRVDWEFLQGTLVRLGFPEKWVIGVSSLYNSACSSVLAGGVKGDEFQISRSVRQGCPLAPYLFLFFAEAMSLFLTAEDVGLKGIAMPIDGTNVVDVEFADDTSLYLDCHNNNLQKMYTAMQTFCIASGAAINWNKSVGFWVSSDSTTPQWSPHPDFRWVPEGTSVRYLGCQVGLNISSEIQVASLLLKIRKKLMFWSKAKLSFAGRVIVVNHVLLSSLWYIMSCWSFSRSCMGQLQRLIRNYLWSGNDGSHARAKVSWSTIVKPLDQGGLGIVDPLQQSKALMAKLVIRGLLPGSEPWKQLLFYELQRFCPKTGGDWTPSARWAFMEHNKLAIATSWEDRFARCVLKAWKDISRDLVKTLPKTESEFCRQPLIWNSWLTDLRGQMLGKRTKCAWAELDRGPAQSIGAWITFLSKSIDQQMILISNIRGGKIMYSAIQNALVNVQMQIGYTTHKWMGLFTPLDVLIGVKAYIGEQECMTFDVQDDGRLI